MIHHKRQPVLQLRQLGRARQQQHLHHMPCRQLARWSPVRKQRASAARHAAACYTVLAPHSHCNTFRLVNCTSYTAAAKRTRAAALQATTHLAPNRLRHVAHGFQAPVFVWQHLRLPGSSKQGITASYKQQSHSASVQQQRCSAGGTAEHQTEPIESSGRTLRPGLLCSTRRTHSSDAGFRTASGRVSKGQGGKPFSTSGLRHRPPAGTIRQ